MTARPSSRLGGKNTIGWLFGLIALNYAVGGLWDAALSSSGRASESTIVGVTWASDALWLPGT